MARRDSVSWTQRLGGNRALVLGVVMVILVLFTVDAYLLPAFGVGSRGGAEWVRFTVGGRVVSLSQAKFQAGLQDWQFFQRGLRTVTGMLRGESEEYLEDLMLAERARDAGVVIPDGAVREFVLHFPRFLDARGEFDSRTFDDALAREFGRLTPRAFEEQVRLHLLVDHLRNLYGRSLLQVSDEDAFKRWKSESQKVSVAFTWLPVAPVREGLTPADLKPGDLEEFWKNSLVQLRHRAPRRFAFEAAWVTVASVADAAFQAAREAAKDDADLRLGEDEAFDYWVKNQRNGFEIQPLTDTRVKALRAENEARVRAEDAEHVTTRPPEPGAPGEGTDAAPLPDLYEVPPESLPPRELFRRYWQARVVKEVWLRKRMERLLADAREGKGSLEELAAAMSRPGLEVKLHRQEEPVDQYGVEKVPGLGRPNCPLRYSINQKKKEDEGKLHGEVIEATADAGPSGLDERGWVVFRPTLVRMEAVPPLDEVRDRVVEECLDERARERTRADAEAFRKYAEDARKGLVEAATEKGLPSETTDPFNAYSWRPPFAPPKPGEELPPASERWKDPGRRLALVMSRYSAFRETPPDSYASVLDDTEGTGACYVVQVTGRADPAFEEMTLTQKNRARQALMGERIREFDRELSYASLKERHGLLIDGKPPEVRPAREE